MTGLQMTIRFARSMSSLTASIWRTGFDGVEPAGDRPAVVSSGRALKLYIYGYLNRVHSSRRLEREAGRNSK